MCVQAVTKCNNELLALQTGLVRRDYGRKLKFRSNKYQTQLESRSAESYSVGNEVDYVMVLGDDNKWRWEQYVRHYLSEDTTQDATQAYLQMRQTHDWLVKVRGAKFIIYFEDGARQQ